MSVHKWFCTLLCYVLLAGSVLADALDQWHCRYPDLPANNLWGAAYGNGVYVAVGDFGNILYCTNLQQWNLAAVPTDERLTQVIFAGNKFLAVGAWGTILWSTNGMTWAEAESGIIDVLWSIAYGANTFVAVGNFGTILTSPDGLEWTPQVSGTFSDIYGVAWNGSSFLAMAWSPFFLQSTNGKDWTTAVQAGSPYAQLAAGNHMFVATYDTSLIVSSNGTVWSHLWHGESLHKVIFDGSQFLVYGSESIFTSADGWHWEQHPGTSFIPESMCKGPQGYLGVSYGGDIHTSENGLTWITQRRGNTVGLQRFVAGNNQIVCIDNYKLQATFARGPGGIGTPLVRTNESGIRQLSFGNGFFLLEAGSGYYRSADGTNWSEPVYAPSFAVLKHLNGWFLGLTQRYIWRSDQGTNWDSWAELPVQWQLNDVAFGDGKYVALGQNGGIFISTDDGASWTTIVEDTNSTGPTRIIYGNGKFVCSGGGALISSPDGETWQTNATPSTISKVLFADGFFIGIGYYGVETSVDGIHWLRRHPTPGFPAPYDITFDGSSVWLLTSEGLLQSDPLSGAPLIVSQPVSRTNSAGGTVTFGIQVSGVGPFSYQWQKNGTNIAGATNATLTLSAVSSGHAGSYTVVVSNAAGTVVSAPALLTVEQEAALVISVQRLTAVSIEGKVGRMHRLEFSPVMGPGATWQTLTNLILPTSPYLLIDYGSGSGQRFYRAVLMP